MRSGKEPLALSRAKGKHLFSLSRVNGRLRCFAAAQHDIPELAFINVLYCTTVSDFTRPPDFVISWLILLNVT